MLSEGDKNKVWIHLFQGEQDGFRRKIEMKTKPPQRFYIWHVADEVVIGAAKGKTRMVIQNKLATMAYELYEDTDTNPVYEGERELRYRRLESADKVQVDPAA